MSHFWATQQYFIVILLRKRYILSLGSDDSLSLPEERGVCVSLEQLRAITQILAVNLIYIHAVKGLYRSNNKEKSMEIKVSIKASQSRCRHKEVCLSWSYWVSSE